MGRRNRANRNKEKKNAKDAQSEIRYISPEAIMSAKEHFLKSLKNIYSLYLDNFAKLLNSKQNNTNPNLGEAEIFLDPPNYEFYHKFDDSQEFQHIFYAQLTRFLSFLLENLRDLEIHDSKYIFTCILDAFGLLESACKDIEKVTNFLFIKAGFDCKSMLRLFFHEKLINDKFIQKILIENGFYTQGGADLYQITDFGKKTRESINNGNKNNGKKKKKKKKKCEIVEKNEEVDLEVEEFEKLLAAAEAVVIKSKPNVSNVWIEGLKKQLKNLVFNTIS